MTDRQGKRIVDQWTEPAPYRLSDHEEAYPPARSDASAAHLARRSAERAIFEYPPDVVLLRVHGNKAGRLAQFDYVPVQIVCTGP